MMMRGFIDSFEEPDSLSLRDDAMRERSIHR